MLDRLSDCMLYQFVGAIMLSLCIERYQWIHSVKKILFFLVDLCDQEFFSIFTYPVLFSCKWFEQNVHLTILLKKKWSKQIVYNKITHGFFNCDHNSSIYIFLLAKQNQTVMCCHSFKQWHSKRSLILNPFFFKSIFLYLYIKCISLLFNVSKVDLYHLYIHVIVCYSFFVYLITKFFLYMFKELLFSFDSPFFL